MTLAAVPRSGASPSIQVSMDLSDVGLYATLLVADDLPRLFAAPCPPQRVELLGSCSPDRQLRWNFDPDADYFVVSVKPENGTQHSYKTGEASWRINHLTCGQDYYAYVTAFRGSCKSMPSLTVRVPSGTHAPSQTRISGSEISARPHLNVHFWQSYSEAPPAGFFFAVPCKPQQVSGNLECGTNSAWVMWEPSPGALTYRVTAESVDGHNSSCSGSPSSSPCNVPSLQCGMIYTFRVTAIGHSCESQLSSIYKLMTGTGDTSASPQDVTISA